MTSPRFFRDIAASHAAESKTRTESRLQHCPPAADGSALMPRGHILFSQEKDAKVIQGVLPLDIPLMGLAALPAVWAAPPGAG